MKKLLSGIMCLTLILLIGGHDVHATEKYDNKKIDNFLIKTGMPQSIISKLDNEQKKYIYETGSKRPDKLVYSGYCKKPVKLSSAKDEAKLSYISRSDLELTVVGFQEGDKYSIYPSFEWKKEATIGNDSFGFALPDGWTLVPSAYNLRTWNKLREQDSWTVVEDLERPSSTDGFHGYTWRIPSSYRGHAYVKANAYFYAKPTTSSPDRRLAITYVHDKTRSLNASYSLAIGPLSISLTSGTNVDSTSDLLGF